MCLLQLAMCLLLLAMCLLHLAMCLLQLAMCPLSLGDLLKTPLVDIFSRQLPQTERVMH
jgi:hypothetical protein